MESFYIILVGFSLILHGSSLPVNSYSKPQVGKTVAEQSAGYFQGDMIIVEDDRARGAPSRPAYQRWPNRTVPYEITGSIASNHATLIVDSMRIMENVTRVNGVDCIKFRPRVSADQYFIYVQNGSGCSATVGANIGWSGNRTLSLFHSASSGSCMYTGIIQHELLHILGFFHEQSRPDRDSYVTIQLSNVIPGYEHNFNKYNDTQVDTLQTPYDYGSVMHYENTAFTSNGQPTIIPTQNASAGLGQRNGMSPIDILEVQRYYGCVPMPSTSTTLSSTSVSTLSSSSSSRSSSLSSSSSSSRSSTSSTTSQSGGRAPSSVAKKLYNNNLAIYFLLSFIFFYIHFF